MPFRCDVTYIVNVVGLCNTHVAWGALAIDPCVQRGCSPFFGVRFLVSTVV